MQFSSRVVMVLSTYVVKQSWALARTCHVRLAVLSLGFHILTNSWWYSSSNVCACCHRRMHVRKICLDVVRRDADVCETPLLVGDDRLPIARNLQGLVSWSFSWVPVGIENSTESKCMTD
jgi:hypothetical protein